jgi:hypothetical protein
MGWATSSRAKFRNRLPSESLSVLVESVPQFPGDVLQFPTLLGGDGPRN